MGLRRLTAEHFGRIGLLAALAAFPLGLAGAWAQAHTSSDSVTVHGRLSQEGGWLPGTLHARVGVPLRLKLVSDDVVHGFAIGRSAAPTVDMPPGEVVETTLTFTEPGTYTYYCARWCGPDHWRMRGVIEVEGKAPAPSPPAPPLYQTLGIDLDAPHPAAVLPAMRPSARRGRALGIDLPAGSRTRDDFIQRSPAEIWQILRQEPSTAGLTDMQVWDLTAHLWRTTTTPQALREGRALYAQNCAACHGESGAGDGIFASAVERTPAGEHAAGGHARAPADFSDPATMLGVSSAGLHGKILRGGMGTGMPYWGPILADDQLWSLTDMLWSFQFKE